MMFLLMIAMVSTGDKHPFRRPCYIDIGMAGKLHFSANSHWPYLLKWREYQSKGDVSNPIFSSFPAKPCSIKEAAGVEVLRST